MDKHTNKFLQDPGREKHVAIRDAPPRSQEGVVGQPVLCAAHNHTLIAFGEREHLAELACRALARGGPGPHLARPAAGPWGRRPDRVRA